MAGFRGIVLAGGPMDGVVATPGAPSLRADWWTTWPAARRSVADRLLGRHPRAGRYRGWGPGRYVRIPEARSLTFGWVPYDEAPPRGRAIVPWVLLLLAAYAVLTRDALGPLLALNIGDVFLRVLANMDDFEKDVVKKGGAGADRAGNSLGGKMSKGLTRGITAVSAAGGVMLAGAIESGAQFEDQLRTINTVAGLSDDELNKVGDSIQGLSVETGKTTDDLTAGFYDLVSAGVPAAKAMDVLRDSAILGTGALGTTGEAVDLVTSAMGAYGLEASESGRITDIFAQAVASGKTTVADLAGGISTVAPIAAAAGISLEEVAAATAQMTLKGDTASQAMTRIKSTVSALITPNETLNKIQERTGVNFAKLADEKGLVVALEELRKATNGNNEEFGKAVGSSDALTLAFALTGDSAGDSAAMLDLVTQAGQEGGVALGQYEEKSKSSVEQGKRFAAQLNVLAQDFGGAFAGAAPFLTTINQLGPAFGGLISPAKLLGGVLGGALGKSLTMLGKLPIPTGPLGKLGARISAAVAGGVASKAAETAIGDAVGNVVADGVSGSVKGPRLGKLRAAGTKIATAIFKPIGLAIAASSAGAQLLGSGIAAVFGKVAALPVIGTAVTAMGSALGTLVAGALALAIPAAIVASAAAIGGGIALAVKAVFMDPGLQQQTRDIGASLDEQIATGVGDLEQSKAALETGIAQIKAVPFGDFLYGDQIRDLTAQLDAVNAELATRAKGLPDGVVTALEYGKSEVDDSARLMMSGIGTAAQEDAYAAGVEVGGEVPAGVGAGILEEQGKVDAAMSELTNLIENERTPAQQASHVIGQLISKEVSNGVVSGRAGVKDAARTLREGGEAELRAFIAGGGKIGKKAMGELRDGMKSKDPEIRNQSKRTLKIIQQETDKLKGVGKKGGEDLGGGVKTGIDNKKGAVKGAASGYRTAIKAQLPSSNEGTRWGSGLGSAYAGGIRSSKKWAVQAARNTASAVAAILATSSPPGPLSPLHLIDKWGAQTIREYAGGMDLGAPDAARAALGAAQGAADALGGVQLPGPAIAAPRVDGARAFAATTAARQGAPPTGDTINYNLPVTGYVPVKTAADTVAAMRRISEVGELPPKLLSPQYPRGSGALRP